MGRSSSSDGKGRQPQVGPQEIVDGGRVELVTDAAERPQGAGDVPHQPVEVGLLPVDQRADPAPVDQPTTGLPAQPLRLVKVASFGEDDDRLAVAPVQLPQRGGEDRLPR
jgi:hypothetical protein